MSRGEYSNSVSLEGSALCFPGKIVMRLGENDLVSFRGNLVCEGKLSVSRGKYNDSVSFKGSALFPGEDYYICFVENNPISIED